MYQKQSQTQLRKIDPSDAERFLSYNTFEGQRKLNQRKVNNYVELMRSGAMRDIDISIATTPDGKRHLMNGQHVCNAVVAYGRPYNARIDYYRCSDYTDLWHLFGTYDVHQSRTDQQIIRGARGLFENELLRDVPLAILHLCSTALFALSLGSKPQFGRTPPAKTDKAELLEKYCEEVLWVHSIKPRLSSESTGRFMERVGVITAMIATRRANIGKANSFWISVRDTEMMLKTDPRKKLHDRLLISGGHNACGDSNHVKLYTICVCYWNSWISGKERKIIQLNSMKELPQVLS